MSKDAMRLCGMTVFKPSRRKNYVARWADPETFAIREKSMGTHVKRDAFQKAMELADKIVRGVRIGDIAWEEFCDIYTERVYAHRSRRCVEPWETTKAKIAAMTPIRMVSQATTAWATKFQNALRQSGLSVNTIASYSARLRAALNWAVDHGYLARAPKIRVSTEAKPRGRALLGYEFGLLLSSTAAVRPHDAPQWVRLLRAQVYSGLRISELLALCWEPDADVAVQLTGSEPLIRINRQKNRQRQHAAAFPEFWQLVAQTPLSKRKGPVFAIRPGGGTCLSPGRVKRTISDIGRASGVLTDPETGKYVTSHDLRRTFAVRLLQHLSLAEAHKAMRHAHISTTLAYYHTMEAETISAKLRAANPGATGGAGGGTVSHPPAGGSPKSKLPKSDSAEGTGLEPATG